MPSKEYLKKLYNEAMAHRDLPGQQIHAVLLLRELSRLRPESWKIPLFYGEALADIGKYHEAIESVRKAQGKVPEGILKDALLLEGTIHYGFNNHSEADVLFDSAIKESSKTPGFLWIYKGANLAGAGKLKEALACHLKSLESDVPPVDKDEAHLNIGYILRSQEDFEGARKHFLKALEIDPEYQKAQEGLAELEGIEETIKLKSQINSISNQNAEHPDEDGLQIFLDEAYEKIKGLRKQNKTIQEVILARSYLTLRNKAWNTRAFLGDALRRIGLVEESKEHLQIALQQVSKKHKGWVCNRLALLHEYYISLKEAETWHQRATEEFENPYRYMWINRGQNLFRLSEFSKARQCFERALQCKEEDEGKDEAFFEIGKLDRLEENFEEAALHFQKTLEENPDFEDARIALNGLEGIEETLATCKHLSG